MRPRGLVGLGILAEAIHHSGVSGVAEWCGVLPSTVTRWIDERARPDHYEAMVQNMVWHLRDVKRSRGAHASVPLYDSGQQRAEMYIRTVPDGPPTLDTLPPRLTG